MQNSFSGKLFLLQQRKRMRRAGVRGRGSVFAGDGTSVGETTDCSTDSDLALTPLDKVHRAAGAQMCPFAGYRMPLHYGSILAEHQACRTAAALFDVSHMGRLRFEGADAARLLDRLLTRRVSDMRPGQVRYSLVCNADGGVLDDVLVGRIETPSGADYFLMVVNAANRGKIWRWIAPHAAEFPAAHVTDRTELSAMIAVQGPRAIPLVEPLVKTDLSKLKRYRSVVTEQFGKPVIISRTGYTGEDGVELIVREDHAARIWENLLLAGRDQGVRPAGLGARDTLRLEAGMPLYGHELSEEIDPLSAGLAFACDLEERDFIGGEALRQIERSGPARRRIGLGIDGRRPAREGSTIHGPDGGEIGHVTSGTVSPTLGTPIAMGYVPADFAGEGTQLEVDIRGKRTGARVVGVPFYSRSR